MPRMARTNLLGFATLILAGRLITPRSAGAQEASSQGREANGQSAVAASGPEPLALSMEALYRKFKAPARGRYETAVEFRSRAPLNSSGQAFAVPVARGCYTKKYDPDAGTITVDLEPFTGNTKDDQRNGYELFPVVCRQSVRGGVGTNAYGASRAIEYRKYLVQGFWVAVDSWGYNHAFKIPFPRDSARALEARLGLVVVAVPGAPGEAQGSLQLSGTRDIPPTWTATAGEAMKVDGLLALNATLLLVDRQTNKVLRTMPLWRD